MPKLSKKDISSKNDKDIKSNKSNIAINQYYNYGEVLSQDEKGAKSDEEKRLSAIEKMTKLHSKNLQYYIEILFLSVIPASLDDFVDILSFNHRSYFNENYLKPLCTLCLIQRTNPDKSTSPNQKHLVSGIERVQYSL